MLNITTTVRPATDLGYLLGKHPDRLQSFPQTYGQAHVFYPVASAERCTATLLLEIDPLAITRRASGANPNAPFLQQYVNDRPYTANSHLAVAIASVFGSALNGNCSERPELAETPIPLEVEVPAIRCPHGEVLIPRFFEPLGYRLQVDSPLMDPRLPHLGPSRHHALTLSSEHLTLAQVLRHLYVLLPAMDNQKHYWIDRNEVDKLVRHSQDWLSGHPEAEVITRRYLGQRPHLTLRAMNALNTEPDLDQPAPSEREPAPPAVPATDPQAESLPSADRPDQPAALNLQQQRINDVFEILKSAAPSSVIDVGCGEGELAKLLVQQTKIPRITALDVSQRQLEIAARRLRSQSVIQAPFQRLNLIHASATYRDPRTAGHQAAVAMEIVEHIDPDKLAAFTELLLEPSDLTLVVVTTPNREFNRVYNHRHQRNDRLRHWDHRFEWDQPQFQAWAGHAAAAHGYSVDFRPVGAAHPQYGPPTQMAVFTR